MARVWLFGNDIDTDQIIPGRYSPYMTSEAKLAQYTFIEHRPEFAQNVQPGDIIVAGSNFGCGSSREYAPRAIQKCGVVAIIAPSFARIFFRNSVNLGIPLIEADLTAQLQDGDEVRLDLDNHILHSTNNGIIQLPTPPQFVQDIQAVGGIVAYYQRYGRFPGQPHA